MTNPYIDTIIGTAVVFFIFSVMAFVIQEFWAALRESRGKMLQKAIYDLLNDKLNKGYGVLLFEHPQFNFLKKTDNRLPSYLPSVNFADALIDLISRESYDLHFTQNTKEETGIISSIENSVSNNTKVKMVLKDQKINEKFNSKSEIDIINLLSESKNVFELFKVGLSQMKTSNLKILLQNILSKSDNSDELRKNIEIWYNDYMDRVSGWYLYKVNINLRFIGIALAIIFNIHAFNLITSIYSDRQLRDKLVNTGENIVDNADYWQSLYSNNLNYALAILDSNCNKQIEILNNDSSQINKEISQRTIQNECMKKRMELADSFAKQRYRQIAAINDSIKLWDLPIGWKLHGKGTAASASGADFKQTGQSWIWIIFGWIASGLAISAGAPFWFNLLNKFVNIRRSGIKPEQTAS